MQVGFKATGRVCSQPGCRGRLRDFVLDWESALPEAQLQETERQVAEADLVLCLGTSLQIVPVCNLPFKPAKPGVARQPLAQMHRVWRFPWQQQQQQDQAGLQPACKAADAGIGMALERMKRMHLCVDQAAAAPGSCLVLSCTAGPDNLLNYGSEHPPTE